MRILCIPDIHGSTHWKKVKALSASVDKIVFLGDYVDDWETTWLEQKPNLEEILAFKTEQSEKVTLLLGNHDLAYLGDGHISGHQRKYETEIRKFFLEHLTHFSIAVEYEDWVFSHAGFGNYFVNMFVHGKAGMSVVDIVNQHLQEKDFSLFDFHGFLSPSGDEVTQTPTWIRPASLLQCAYFKKQVVGHTEVKNPPAFLEHKRNKVIIVDSSTHDCLFVLDTEKAYEFQKL